MRAVEGMKNEMKVGKKWNITNKKWIVRKWMWMDDKIMQKYMFHVLIPLKTVTIRIMSVRYIKFSHKKFYSFFVCRRTAIFNQFRYDEEFLRCKTTFWWYILRIVSQLFAREINASKDSKTAIALFRTMMSTSKSLCSIQVLNFPTNLEHQMKLCNFINISNIIFSYQFSARQQNLPGDIAFESANHHVHSN